MAAASDINVKTPGDKKSAGSGAITLKIPLHDKKHHDPVLDFMSCGSNGNACTLSASNSDYKIMAVSVENRKGWPSDTMLKISGDCGRISNVDHVTTNPADTHTGFAIGGRLPSGSKKPAYFQTPTKQINLHFSSSTPTIEINPKTKKPVKKAFTAFGTSSGSRPEFADPKRELTLKMHYCQDDAATAATK